MTASRRTIYRSAALAVLMQWSVRCLGLVSVLVLARLLTPSDFGVVGMAMAAVSIVEILGAIGLRQALLRIPAPDRSHLDTAWTIQLILFSTMALVTVAFAPLAAWFYGNPVLTAVIAALALRFLCLGVVNIGVVDFDRNFQFGRDLRMRVSARAAAFLLTLSVALLLRNYWALVVGLISQSAFFAIGSYLSHPYRPRCTLARRSELLAVSVWMLLNAIAQAGQQQIERLVLGRFGTVHLVGLYSVSKDLSEIFTQEIATALNRVTFVTLAGEQEPLRKNSDRIARVLGSYAMLAAPMGLGLAVTAEDFIALLLGSQWLPAAPLLRIVAIYSAFYAVYKVISSALQASGFARTAASMSFAGALVTAVSVSGVALLHPSATAIAFTALVANAATLATGTIVIARYAATNPLALGVHIARPFAAAGLMYGGVALAAPSTGILPVDLSVAIAFGAALYPLFLVLIWRVTGSPEGAESEALRVAGAAAGELGHRLRGKRQPL
jgi:O-antigen/teichoic acid export membrane protein